jgi:hypothetical protein
MCIGVNVDGVWIGKWIYWPLIHSRLVTTSSYSATASIHTLQITTAQDKYFPAWCVFFNSGYSSASRAQVFSSPIAACLFVAAGTCLSSRCSEMIIIYRITAYHRVCASQYPHSLSIWSGKILIKINISYKYKNPVSSEQPWAVGYPPVEMNSGKIITLSPAGPI